MSLARQMSRLKRTRHTFVPVRLRDASASNRTKLADALQFAYFLLVAVCLGARTSWRCIPVIESVKMYQKFSGRTYSPCVAQIFLPVLIPPFHFSIAWFWASAVRPRVRVKFFLASVRADLVDMAAVVNCREQPPE